VQVPLLASSLRWEEVVLLSPAIVVAVGIIAAVIILLGRAFAASLRESGHPRWIYAALVGLVGVVVVLTWLGVSLPRE
jgi:FtsH-binding integral membrane protein